MTSYERALGELELAGLVPAKGKLPDGIDYNGEAGKCVVQLLGMFRSQKHSGASAMLVANIFYRLVRGEVLSPLTGEETEWMELATEEGPDGNVMYQNKRCFSIFAEDMHGKNAVNVAGRVFIGADGASFTNSKYSSTPVAFPCIPTTEYVREGTEEARPFADVFDGVKDDAK